MKECPFSRKTCGDWCQLFKNGKCIFESIDTWLDALLLESQEKSD